MRDDTPVLDVEPLDLHEVALVGLVLRDELGDHGHGLVGVHLEVGSLPVVIARPHPVSIEIAAILIADAHVPLAELPTAAIDAAAPEGALDVAGVRGEGGGLPIRLPNVHLEAAHAVLAVDVRNPVLPLDVVGALRVAIPCAELRPGRVGALALAAMLVHLDEVERPVHAASEASHVDVEAELAVLQLEHVVGVLAVGDVEAGTDIAALGHEL
mmetsp:Transcript_49708/g.138064  ORF Transcript_49708/g.138064 Transcript_49708/m.138064 type:complete len:213 (+) Transcript_49708:848-1486(+)